MSSVALAPAAIDRPAINPWFVAVAVVVPTFMEVLDTTIANVALRYIAGGLSAAVTDSEWVLTSYLAANAFVLPISGWISAHLGRRNYFLLSIAVFTIASGLCGMATSLEQLILFRVIQGLAGGGLQPSSQGVLLDAFPREKQGQAQTLVRRGRADRAGGGADPGGLPDGELRLAVDLLHQPAGGCRRLCRRLFSGSRSAVPQARAGPAPPSAAEFRLHRLGPLGARHVELGNHAQQGAGVGLAGRPFLAHPDAADRIRRSACWR